MTFKDRGYWVAKTFKYQSLLHYLLSAARHRSMTYFSAVNPVIELGGMLDEHKSDIYNLLPGSHIPKTVISRKGQNYISALALNDLHFPLILKPNVGFKGHLVVKVNNEEEMHYYFEQSDGREILIQEYIDLPREYSIMYFRYPISRRSGISSVIEKKYPYTTGDGVKSLNRLVEDYNNPFLDKEWVFKSFKKELNRIPAKGEKIILDSIGNYSRGAKFYSLNEVIDEELINATDQFFSHIKGLNFFRMDIKSDSLEAYKSGSFKILEINGAKSEPLHIYDPKYSFAKISKDIHRHWSILNSIVKETQFEREKLPSFKSGWKSYKAVKKLMK